MTLALAALLTGVLTPPSSSSPLAIAQAWLATRPPALAGVPPADLRVERVRAIPGGGALVKLTQTAAPGIDVAGATVAIRIDARGRIRWVHAHVEPLPAGFETTPRLSAAAARVAAGAPAHAHAELLVHRPGPAVAPRLAWRVWLPANAARMESRRVVVDAVTGRLLAAENLVDHAAQALVFEENPTRTPSLTQVTLPLPPAATALANADFTTASCTDDGTCQPVDVNGVITPIHACGFAVRAAPDASGDFLYPRPAMDTDQTDPFAEVQLFYHANKTIAWFRGFGFVDFDQKPMRAVANWLIADYSDLASVTCTGSPPVPNPGDVLQPMDNAAFFRARTDGSFPSEDMIIFGQGTSIDLAYDGDVTYHELGHALMGTICPEYGRWVQDARGLDLLPHGTYEGYADWVALAITNDSELGDYSGPGLGAGGPIRSGLNTRRCPDDLWGEEHYDGEPWMGALWDIRSALAAAEQGGFDGAVYTVLDSLGAGETPVGDTSNAIAAELEVVLGPAARDLALAKFAARGFDDCDDRVIDFTAGGTKDFLLLRGRTYLGMDTLVPAIVQFRIDVPAPASAITVSIANSARPGSLVPQIPVPPGVKLLVKKDAPITWTWDANGSTPDTTLVGDVTFLGANGGAGSGEVTGDFAPGTYYVQLANDGGSWYVVNTSFGHVAAPIPDAGPPPPDAAPPDAAVGEDGEGGGCGCRAGARGGRSTSPLLTALALAAALAARKRLRRR